MYLANRMMNKIYKTIFLAKKLRKSIPWIDDTTYRKNFCFLSGEMINTFFQFFHGPLWSMEHCILIHLLEAWNQPLKNPHQHGAKHARENCVDPLMYLCQSLNQFHHENHLKLRRCISGKSYNSLVQGI